MKANKPTGFNPCIGICVSRNRLTNITEGKPEDHIAGYKSSIKNSIDEIFATSSPEYICGFIQKPTLTAEERETILKLLHNNVPYKMFLASKTINLNENIINTLASDDSMFIRLYVAAREDITETAMQKLSADTERIVLESLIANPQVLEKYKLIAALYRET